MDKISDRDIINGLRSSDALDNEKALAYLYRHLYPKTVAYIRKNNGSEQEARDIFQDALFAFYKLIREDRLPADTKAEAYLFIVFRNLWLKKLQRRKREIPLDQKIHDAPIEIGQLEELIITEKHALLDAAIEALGPECRAILVSYYYDRLRMVEICKILNFSSVQVTKNKKYNCMKKLKQLVLNSDYFREMF